MRSGCEDPSLKALRQERRPGRSRGVRKVTRVVEDPWVSRGGKERGVQPRLGGGVQWEPEHGRGLPRLTRCRREGKDGTATYGTHEGQVTGATEGRRMQKGEGPACGDTGGCAMGRGLGALASGPPRCLCCFSSLFPRRDPTQAPPARWSHNLYLKCTSGHLPLLLKQTRAPGEQSAWQDPGLASESVAMSPQP